MKAIPYWRLSSFYLFYFATLGSFLPFWPLYLQSESYRPQQIGLLMALILGTKVISPFLFGWIADHRGKSLTLIRLGCWFAFWTFLLLMFDRGYEWMVAVSLLFSFFWNGVLPQFEAVTLTHLHGRTDRYSWVRVWGSVGFIAAVLGNGLFFDYFPITLLPPLIAVMMAAIWLSALTVPERAVVEKRREHGSLFAVVRRPAVLAFLLTTLLIQLSHGPYYTFYSIDLESHGYSSLEVGLLWALGVAAEVILFLFMHRILKRYSLRGIILVSALLAELRWLLIAWSMGHPVGLVVAQLLHAASFGSMHVASIHLCHYYFHGPHHGRGQALYSSVSFGLGAMFGSYGSGLLWERLGADWVFMLAAGVALLALLVAWCWVGKDLQSEGFNTAA